jgi:hypothetical protein
MVDILKNRVETKNTEKIVTVSRFTACRLGLGKLYHFQCGVTWRSARTKEVQLVKLFNFLQ